MADQNNISPELLQQINFEMERYGQLTGSTADALRDARTGVKGFSDAVRAAPKALGDAAGSMASAMYKGTKGAAAYNTAVDSMAAAASSAVTVLQAMIPGGPIIKAFVGAVAFVTKFFIKTASEAQKLLATQGDALFNSYQKMSAAGAVAAGGTTEMGKSLYKMGLSFEDADQMIQQFSENSEDLALFGGSVYKGAEAMQNVVDAAKPFRVQLESLGLNQEAQNEAIMGYIKVQTRLGNGGKLQAQGYEATAAAATRYIAEQDALTKVTGISRKAQEKALDEAMRNARFAATVDMMRANGQGQAADQLTFVMQAAGKLGPQFQKGMTDLVNGIPDSDEAAAVLRSSGGDALKLINMVTSNQIQDQKQLEQAFSSMVDTTAQTTKGLQSLYATAGDSKSFVVYNEVRRAFELVGDDGTKLAKVFEEAREQVAKQLAGEDERTRTQADTAVKQRDAMLKTQATADLAIDLSVKGVNRLATAAEAAADALYKLTKTDKEKEAAIAANTPKAQEYKAAKENEELAYKDAGILQEVGIGRTEEQKAATAARKAADQQRIEENQNLAKQVTALPAAQQDAARVNLPKQAVGGGLPAGVKAPAMANPNRLPGQARPPAAPPAAPMAAPPAAPVAIPYTSGTPAPVQSAESKPAETVTSYSDRLLKFIKSTERFTPTAAWDSKQWSNGYGTKALSPTGGKDDPAPRETVDEATARTRMTAFLQNAVSTVITFGKKHGYNWNQGQVDALTSLSYNAGIGVINQITDKGTRSNEEIAAKILEYNKAENNKTSKKEILPGLITRRQEELAMFQGARDGGIFEGPKSGYPMTLHGSEAVIPLKNGSVPVNMNLEGLSRLMPSVPVKNGAVPVTLKSDTLFSPTTTASVNDNAVSVNDDFATLSTKLGALAESGSMAQIKDTTATINTKLDVLVRSMPTMPVKDGAVPVTIKSDILSSPMPKPDMDKENTAELAQDFKENIGSQLKQLVSEITTQLQRQMPENNNQELVQLMQDFVRGQRQMIATSDRLLQVAQN